jgi:hypothetical protein
MFLELINLSKVGVDKTSQKIKLVHPRISGSLKCSIAQQYISDMVCIYCFYFDTLILHPRYFKKKRKSTPKTINSPSVKGKRGRPKKDPKDLKTPQIYVPTGRKRGRPRKDPKNLKTPRVYVPTGGKKGRPKKK